MESVKLRNDLLISNFQSPHLAFFSVQIIALHFFFNLLGKLDDAAILRSHIDVILRHIEILCIVQVS